MWAPPELAVNVHEAACADPGYEAHRRYFREARHHTAPGGRVLIALSSRAGHAELARPAAAEAQALTPVAATTVREPEGPVVYELLELVPL
ncbi:hypothetical protein [Streptomyces beigongshangae]|uniref:hypothetical protein n=1 Tax=Streptomyces beigongshangae TaxID=2841597 RepID=UPI001C85BF17|nr:hypothetical protein [Streptomyces sp. REN17]